MSQLTDQEVEKLVRRARDLTEGMWGRVKRLPDYADFRAAFAEEIKMSRASKTPTLDKFNLHPCGGYCTCFSNSYSSCAICEATKAQQKRWEGLSPENKKKAEAEYDYEYPRTSNQDGR